MINIDKNDEHFNVILIQKPQFTDEVNFTLILQNNVSKEIYKYNVINVANKGNIYLQFEVSFEDLIDGEYTMLILVNSTHSDVQIKPNNIKDFKEEKNIVYILTNKDNILTNKDFVIVQSKDSNVYLYSMELVKVGDYQNPNKQYNNEKKFITYNG